MEKRQTRQSAPFFSVCIPQYNRTSFLLTALKSVADQSFRDFEVCISDDCSTDGRHEEAAAFLKKEGIPFAYRRQEKNVRYDANLRASIDLARGEYCFLLGNDDSLVSPDVFDILAREIRGSGPAGVVITNYKDFLSGKLFRRVTKTGIAGSGPHVAAGAFRSMSFVSGVVLNAEKAKQHATDMWDGSEMYQMFIGCRIVSQGMPLLTIDDVIVRYSIQVPGERVNSYACAERLRNCPIIERRIPLMVLPRLVISAIAPYLPAVDLPRVAEKVFLQVYLFTYPFWIVEYRRVQSRRFALGICLGMRPRNVIGDTPVSVVSRACLRLLYVGVTVFGLLIPLALFRFLLGFLYRLAKSFH